MKRTNLGEFEELALLTVSVLYRQDYGISIKDEIEKQTGHNLSNQCGSFRFKPAGEKRICGVVYGRSNPGAGRPPKALL